MMMTTMTTMMTTMMTTTNARVRSLRTSISLWVALLAAVGMIGIGLVAGIAGVAQLRDRIDQSLAREMSQFRELAKRHSEETVPSLVRRALEENVPEQHELFAGFLPRNTIAQVGVRDDLFQDPAFHDLVTGAQAPFYGSYHSPTEGEVRFASMPVNGLDDQGEPITAYFVCAYMVGGEIAEMREVAWIYVLTALPALLGVTGVAWMVSSRVLSPLRQLRETANRISGSDVSERIVVGGNDELAQMAVTVNSMLDRLEDSLTAQRDMLDDVGHELRTPITAIRGHLELMDKRDPDDVDQVRTLALDELDRMNLLVTDMITLAKSRRPDFLHREMVNLVDIVTAVLERSTIIDTHMFAADELSEAWVNADRHRLIQAVQQLVHNATCVSPAHSPITLGCNRRGDTCYLWVSDHGPGVSEDLHEAIFDRHFRGTDAYEGTGLGLAIVAAIAAAHDGRARVRESSEQGTVMVIELPAAPVPGGHHARADR